MRLRCIKMKPLLSLLVLSYFVPSQHPNIFEGLIPEENKLYSVVHVSYYSYSVYL
jgi:hypothetical protein